MFATLFVNYLVIECEEAESHRLNYHSWRATGGLIVYRRSGDVGMRKEGNREIILRASPPCFPVSFVNCPLGQYVPIVFFSRGLVFCGRLRTLYDILTGNSDEVARWNYDLISIALRETRHRTVHNINYWKWWEYIGIKMINARLLIINF